MTMPAISAPRREGYEVVGMLDRLNCGSVVSVNLRVAKLVLVYKGDNDQITNCNLLQ